MIEIEPVIFPLSLGTATLLNVITEPFSLEDEIIWIQYELRGQSEVEPGFKVIQMGRLLMDKTVYANWGIDNSYVLQWVAEKLGVTLILPKLGDMSFEGR